MQTKMLSSIFLALFTVSVVQGLTERGLKCVEKIETTKEKITPLAEKMLHDHKIEGEDEELLEKFGLCVLSDHVSDTNEIVVDEKLEQYTTEIFETMMEGKPKLISLLAEHCLHKCKDTKGETKAKTTVEFLKCLLKRLAEYIEK